MPAGPFTMLTESWAAQVRAFSQSAVSFQTVVRLQARRRSRREGALVQDVARAAPDLTGPHRPWPESSDRARRTGTFLPPSRLTRRQFEVAGLIAEGLTNAQIAQRLVLTTGTVGNHVEHILRRLGMSNRAQVAAWMTRRAAPSGEGESAGR